MCLLTCPVFQGKYRLAVASVWAAKVEATEKGTSFTAQWVVVLGGFGFRVGLGLWLRVWGFGFRVWGLGLRARGLQFSAYGQVSVHYTELTTRQNLQVISQILNSEP